VKAISRQERDAYWDSPEIEASLENLEKLVAGS